VSDKYEDALKHNV